MNRRQNGFTMIELIIVIVILGILAAVAMPKFVDLSSEAKQASVDGVAAAAGSAMVINYGGCSALNHAVTANKCKNVTKCTDVYTLVQSAGSTTTPQFSASGRFTTADAAAVTTNGTEFTCTVTYTTGSVTKTSTFVGIAAGN